MSIDRRKFVKSATTSTFAHTLVRSQQGDMVRLVDYVGSLAPGGDWKALLPAPRAP